MNFSQALSDLEEACADFQVPATRFAAEQRLQEFGKRPDAIAAGKYILANSNLPTAQFFAVRGIKDAVVDSYAVLGVANALGLRDELFQMAASNSRCLEAFVLDSLCWVVAVITKRAWVDSSEDQRTSFTKALYADIVLHNSPSIGIITATYLIDEISGGSRCSEFHLPWEFHYSCKASFENAHMPHLFEASLKVLHSQLQRSIEAPAACGLHNITFERRSALHIVERILSWEFTSPDANKVISASFGYSKNGSKDSNTGGSGRKGRSLGIGDGDDDDDESEQLLLDSEDQGRTPVFPSAWRSLLLNGDVITLFFSVYEATFKDQMHRYFSPGSSHIALQCIVQLSGLRGRELFGDTEAKGGDTLRTEYAQIIMRNQLQIIRHVCLMNLTSDGVEDNVMATTQMIRRFIETQLSEQTAAVVAGQRLHPIALLTMAVPETIEYFGEVSNFICTLLQAASGILKSDAVVQIDEDFGDVDNYFIMQAFDELANAWSAVINEIREWEELNEAAPINAQPAVPSMPSSGGVEQGSVQMDNRIALATLKQFLATTGCMIRSEYISLRMLMCEVAIQSVDGDSRGSVMDQGFLEKDYIVYGDQLQFYAMLARLDMRASLAELCEALCNRFNALQEGFRHIESRVNSSGYSVDDSSSHHQEIDLLHEQIHWILLILGYILADSGTSERVLIPKPAIRYSAGCVSPDQDYIVQNAMMLFEILEFEIKSPSSALASYCSPLLAETLFWVLRRVAPVYLLFDQSDYYEMSSNLLAAFGKATDGGKSVAIIQGLLGLVRRTFDLWSSEEDVLRMCVDMLLAFAQRPSIAQEITRSPQFTPLILYFTSNLYIFPESTHSLIIEALALLSCHSVSEEHEKNFSELKTLVLLCLSQTLQDPHFKVQSHDFRVVSKILDGLDMMDGILSAASFQNMDMIFNLFFEVQPIFDQLLSVYCKEHSILIKIIQVIESAAKYLDVSTLADEQKVVFSRSIRTVLLKYQSANDGLTTYEVGADVESMLEVTALMSVVSNLVRNEIGFAPNEVSRSVSKLVSDDFGETEVFGLYCIHTTTTPSQILAPNVMRSYMHLLSEMVEYRTPSLIRWLPVESWKAVLNMLAEGINHDVYDVGRRTYETISKLGAFIKLGGLEGVGSELKVLFHEGVKRLLAKLLRSLLFSPFDAELVEPAGAAMVTLGLIDPAHLQLCFNELFAQGNSAAFLERLSATFAKFNADLESSDAVRKLLSSSGHLPDPIDSSGLRQALFEFLVNTRAILRVK